MAWRDAGLLIKNALEDLSREDFTRFCCQLREPRGDGLQPQRFRRGQVEGKSCQQVADLLTMAFVDKALVTTVSLLRAIHCHRVAKELEDAEQSAPRWGRYQTPPPRLRSRNYHITPKTRVAMSDAVDRGHFLDRHRSELMERVSFINPILEHLLQEEVLQQEQYERAMELGSTQDKLRFLFNGPLRSGGDRGKDVLMAALCIHQPGLMKELM